MPTPKTILVRTVIGKGYKISRQRNRIKPVHTPDSILGCWIINHKYKGEKKEDYTEISGSYEVHVWYSYEDGRQTEVASQLVSYKEQVKVRIFNELERRADGESVVEVTNEPVCIDADIVEQGSEFEVEVEISFRVRELADLYLTVDVFPQELADFEEELEEQLSDIDNIIPEMFEEE